MSRQDHFCGGPCPCPELEKDCTLSESIPQQTKPLEKPVHIPQTEDTWIRLYKAAISACTHSDLTHRVPRDSLDFQLNSIYDHHKDLFWTRKQMLCQRETVSGYRRKREDFEKQIKLIQEEDNIIRVWVDPKRGFYHYY